MEATVFLNVRAHSSKEFVIKLPSPVTEPADVEKLLHIDYDSARAETLKFWSDYVARGAQFQVPEKVVNDLFRATLWHALRLPRRHGGTGDNVQIDLPYSNFAYDQTGTPWPVNQAVYVDYMLYGLRGYQSIADEELRAMYRNNEEADGHVNGAANWGSYTPGMLYAVALDYRLSHDRKALDELMPQTIKALDWCLEQLRRSSELTGPARGLFYAPANDGTGEGIWAFNQAYMFAGLDEFGRVLEEIGHPRAKETLAAAAELHKAIEREFSRASTLSPLVQLRDHTWVPYVPSEALTPRRVLEQWYPTDVHTGAVHLIRLKAIPAGGDLATDPSTIRKITCFTNSGAWLMSRFTFKRPRPTCFVMSRKRRFATFTVSWPRGLVIRPLNRSNTAGCTGNTSARPVRTVHGSNFTGRC